MPPTEHTPITFAAVLQRLRRAAALSQEELAERAGLSLRGISDLERGVRRVPRPVTVRLLAEALALSASDRALLVAAANAHAADSVASRTSQPLNALPRPATSIPGRDVDLREVSARLREAQFWEPTSLQFLEPVKAIQ